MMPKKKKKHKNMGVCLEMDGGGTGMQKNRHAHKEMRPPTQVACPDVGWGKGKGKQVCGVLRCGKGVGAYV